MGDVWTWIAIDRDSKLVPTWRVGDRTERTGRPFIKDLRSRIDGRFQLTSDGHWPYIEAVGYGCGLTVDYAMLVKNYGEDQRIGGDRVCVGLRKTKILGEPDLEQVSTSISERHNVTPEDVHEAVHALDQRLLEEGRLPSARGGALLHVLQLLPDPQVVESDPGHGSRVHESPVGFGGCTGAT